MRASRFSSPAPSVAFAVVTALGAVTGAGFPTGALADDQRQRAAAAEALFQEGRALLMAGKAEQACPKLEESQRLDPATGTLMALALCHEQQGKLASAWAAFADVEGRSRLDGRADRERTAHEHGAALRPRLSTLTLQIAADAAAMPGLTISVDGVAIGRGAWSVAIPVDGGPHVVEAAAPGKDTWRSTISVGRERDHVRVDIAAPSGTVAGDSGPAAPPEMTPPAPPTPRASEPEATEVLPSARPVTAAPPVTRRAEPDEPAADRSAAPAAGSGRRMAGFSLMGGGVLALATGVYLGLDAKRSYDAARDGCAGTACPAGPYGRVQDALSEGNWATVVGAVGGAAIVTGGILWLTAPRASEHASRSGGPRIERVAIQPGGVAVGGTF